MPRLQKHHGTLLLICGLALLLRLSLMPMVHNPGLHDALHYYNLGTRLVEGHGYSIDYVWHYNTMPAQIEHPTDHWMPLTGTLVAASMSLFGINHWASILPFVLMGAALPLLVYAAARQMTLDIRTSLIAAALSVAIPEIVWQSLRPLTTLPQIWCYGGAMLALIAALRHGRWWQYALCGLCIGLAYLNRNDALLLAPMIVLMVLIVARWGSHYGYHVHWLRILLVPVVALLTVAPWLIRNIEVLGELGTSATTKVMLMTTYEEVYTYDDPITVNTWLDQGIGAIISKRLFELAASFKQMATFASPVLPLLIAGGILLMIQQRDLAHGLPVAPVLIVLLVTLVVYPFLLPYYNQAGSFRTAYVSLLPMLLPIVAYAIHTAVSNPRWQVMTAVLIVIWSAALAWDTVRLDTAFNDAYYASMKDISETALALPDITGDGDIRLMAQDPFMLRYYGIRSVVVPYHSIEDVLAAAERYAIDYVMLPTAWSDLDAFYGGRAEPDSHFELAAAIPRGSQSPIELYAIHPDTADASD